MFVDSGGLGWIVLCGSEGREWVLRVLACLLACSRSHAYSQRAGRFAVRSEKLVSAQLKGLPCVAADLSEEVSRSVNVMVIECFSSNQEV